MQVLKDRRGASQPRLILLVHGADSSDQPLDSRSFGPAEFAVLQIDVVDDLGDRSKSRVVQLQMLKQHLEGAAIAFVGEIGLEHVEADFPLLGLIPPRGNEFEFGLRIDKALNQPGACHPINVNSLARDPNASQILAARPGGLIVCRSIRIHTGLETGDQSFCTLTTQRVEEIYSDDFN